MAQMTGMWKKAAIGGAAVAVAAVGVAVVPAGVAGSVEATAMEVAPNPTINPKCKLDYSLMLDASNSIRAADAVDKVRDAADSFVRNLKGTGSTLKIEQFGTAANTLTSRVVVDATTGAPDGELTKGIDDYFAPQPPLPGNGFRYQGSGDWTNPANWVQPPSPSRGWTNWDAGLRELRVGGALPDLAIFLTDGDPTAFDLNEAGDPNGGPGSDNIGFSTDRGDAEQETLRRAIDQANQLKELGVRILVLGVGNAFDNADSQDRLMAISGPQLVDDAQLVDLTSINQVDVAVVDEFDQLGLFLRELVDTNCDGPTPSPSPSPTASPTDSPTPTPTPTPSPTDETPLKVTPSKEKPTVGTWTTVVSRIRTPGEVRTKVTCTVNGTKAKRVCRTDIGKKVRVKALCNDNVDVNVRIRAKEQGKSANVWTKDWTVKKRPYVSCTIRGKG